MLNDGSEIYQQQDVTGIVDLTMAIFRLTSQDLRYGTEENKDEALDFLFTEWFEGMCDGLRLDSNNVRKMIVYNKVQNRRIYEL